MRMTWFRIWQGGGRKECQNYLPMHILRWCLIGSVRFYLRQMRGKGSVFRVLLPATA